jgi:uroporphyrinogen decarboxylase
MDKWSRIQAALRHEAVDRVPLSLWRHFHRQDRTSQGLSEATLGFAREYDLDLVKLTPSGLYAVEDWAGEHIVYPGTDHGPPYLDTPALSTPAEWRRIPVLEPTQGALGRELEAVRLVAAGLGAKTPLMMTIYSPLTLAAKLAGSTVVKHLREHPSSLHSGLATIARTTALFAEAVLEAGADGLFFATQMASYHWLTPAEYAEFGERYDLLVLESAAASSEITVLHLHGRGVFFDLANHYPVQAVSWHDRETPPGLTAARQHTDRTLITGLDRRLLGTGPVEAIRAQVRTALRQTKGYGENKGRGLILAPSCVIPTTAPPEHLHAVCDTLRA